MARLPLCAGVFLLSLSVWAAAPKAVPFEPALAAKRVELASVGQLKDAPEDAAQAGALELLVEKMGVLKALGDERFHGEMECTHGELMLVLAGGLEYVSQMVSLKPEEEFVPAMKRVFDPLQAAAGHHLTSIDECKSVTQDSPYREAVETLVQRYGAYLGAKGADLDVRAAVSRAELAEYGERYFQDDTEKKRIAMLSAEEREAAATRAEMLVLVARGFEKLATLLEK